MIQTAGPDHPIDSKTLAHVLMEYLAGIPSVSRKDYPTRRPTDPPLAYEAAKQACSRSLRRAEARLQHIASHSLSQEALVLALEAWSDYRRADALERNADYRDGCAEAGVDPDASILNRAGTWRWVGTFDYSFDRAGRAYAADGAKADGRFVVEPGAGEEHPLVARQQFERLLDHYLAHTSWGQDLVLPGTCRKGVFEHLYPHAGAPAKAGMRGAA